MILSFKQKLQVNPNVYKHTNLICHLFAFLFISSFVELLIDEFLQSFHQLARVVHFRNLMILRQVQSCVNSRSKGENKFEHASGNGFESV